MKFFVFLIALLNFIFVGSVFAHLEKCEISYISKDNKAYFISIKKSAEAGNASSQHELAFIYEKGLGVEVNFKRAFYWYEQAIKQDYAPSKGNLAIFYREGIAVEMDIEKAILLYQEAAAQGHAPSLFRLGNIYEEVLRGGKSAQREQRLGLDQYELTLRKLDISIDSEKMISLFRQAAEAEYPPAQYKMGILYESGVFIEKNLKEMIRWYQLAAAMDYAPAIYNMGFFYEKGMGVKRNFKRALKLYRKAALQGYVSAMYRLGIMYKRGLGARRDLKKSLKWYEKAAQQRNFDSNQAYPSFKRADEPAFGLNALSDGSRF